MPVFVKIKTSEKCLQKAKVRYNASGTFTLLLWNLSVIWKKNSTEQINKKKHQAFTRRPGAVNSKKVTTHDSLEKVFFLLKVWIETLMLIVVIKNEPLLAIDCVCFFFRKFHQIWPLLNSETSNFAEVFFTN